MQEPPRAAGVEAANWNWKAVRQFVQAQFGLALSSRTEIREYLTTADLKLRLVALPGYSPDFNPDEAIWDWIREDVTANTCFGKATKVREHIDAFFAGLALRTDEVKRRCRRQLQSLAEALAPDRLRRLRARLVQFHLTISLG